MSLMLFQESYAERLEREVAEMRKEMGNLRRGLFARHSELERKYQETCFELELLKSSIAKQDIKIWTGRKPFQAHPVKKRVETPDLFMCGT